MRLSIVRDQLVKEVWVLLTVLVPAGGAAAYSFYDRQVHEDELAKLERDLTLTKNRIVKMEEENTEFVKLFLAYNRIPFLQRESTLSDLPARIAYLQPRLDKLRQLYRLSQLDIALTNVATAGPKFEKEKYTTHFNTLTLNFGGLTDTLVFSFLRDLFQEIPGYIRVEAFEINKQSEVTPAVLLQLQQNTIPVLVSGRIILNWKTVAKK